MKIRRGGLIQRAINGRMILTVRGNEKKIRSRVIKVTNKRVTKLLNLQRGNLNKVKGYTDISSNVFR